MLQEPTHQTPLAAIDIGTNTLRLLVARPAWSGDVLNLETVATRTETVRLGYGVEQTGRLDPERLARAVATIEEYRQIAVGLGVTTILLAATSAVRDAANGEDFRQRVAATSGLDVPIVSGEREAALTFAGATVGESLAGTLLVADLGGGSLELIISSDGELVATQSLQLGSGRLTERHINADPPTRAMIDAAAIDARQIIAPVLESAPAIERLIIVGGTATSVPILVPRPQERAALTARRLDGALGVLTGTPVATLAAETSLDPERIRTLPAGIAIIAALLDLVGTGVATIGTGGIREGLILDYLRRAEMSRGRSE